MEIVLNRALDARRVSPSPARVLAAGYAPRCDTVAGAVGSTPVLWIDRPLNSEGRGFWAKLEGHNPGGMKDRAALHMIECARERGDLPPGGMIVESNDTVFNDDYCHRHGLLTAHLPTEPDEIAYPTEREVTRWTRCRRVLDPTARQQGDR